MTFADEKLKVLEHLPTVTPAQWGAFFGAFEKARNLGPGRMLGGEGVEKDGRMVFSMPFYAMTNEWISWEEAFYHQNIFCPIDWVSLREERYDGWLPSDAAEAVMALVVYIRRNRFAEGALAGDIREGHVHHAMGLLQAAFGSPTSGD